MRIIFLSVLVSLFIWGCNVKSTYDISGFCDGNSLSTVVYLMEIEQGKIVDTLGQVEVLNGRFTLNGETGKDKDCRIELVDDNRKRVLDAVDFVLTGSNFMVYLGNKDHSFIQEDKASQQLARAFYDNEKKFVDTRKVLVQQFITSTERKKDSLGKEFEELIKSYERKENELVEEHVDNKATACAISGYVTSYTFRLKRYLYALGTKINAVAYELEGWDYVLDRYSKLGIASKAWLERNGFKERMAGVRDKMAGERRALKTSEGTIAPDMVLVDMEGNELNLYDVKSKLKLVDFWASWCGPCRRANPFVLSLYKEFKDKGFEVVSVTVDTKKKNWLKAVEEDKLTWKYNVRDSLGQSSSLYGISSVPCMLLLDENNKIIGRNLPKTKLREVIEQVLLE
ncbi:MULTISPECIES: TlpA family protein disulfide reductase [Butyricimonas]|uniref:TlpA family protein disulfide reductase n=1 Tax=Butyricimonas TaxID=574697 RepID=UPI000B38EDCE|nr:MULTISPECIES: TlpA disulfide reductase family protein [Butyricimonas]OUN66340.1 hypothetical protein B5G13_07775 [Butyricimonas sp. An62]